MKDQYLNKLIAALWISFVLVVVSLAFYSSLGRLAVFHLGQYQDALLRELNARLDFTVEVDNVTGEWSSLTPRLAFEGVRVPVDAHVPHALEIETLYAEIDVLGSLLTRTLQLYALVGTHAVLHVDSDGPDQFTIPGLDLGAAAGGGDLYDWLANAELIDLEGVVLHLHDRTGERRLHVEAHLQRDGGFRRLQLSLQTPAGDASVRVMAEGTGPPANLRRFDGLVYIDAAMGDVTRYGTWLEPLGIKAEGGKLDTELWLQVHRGVVQAVGVLEVGGLRLRVPALSPRALALSSLKGAVRAESQDGRWIFGLDDLSLQRGERTLDISHLEGEYDGRGLAMRTANIDPVGALDYIIADESLPLSEQARKTLAALVSQGHIDRAQVTFDDLDDLAQWRLETNFTGLTIDATDIVPGVQNASGYLSMNRNEGHIQLQSTDFSMVLPTIYREPLHYDTFKAKLDWEVHPEAFRLFSGPFAGTGDEGRVHGLFSLEVPLQDSPVGTWMNLMVGLRDFHPRHRAKYLPHTLGSGLLDWLKGIGEGRVGEGAFLWRGSLRKELREHRTTQLYFDLAGVDVEYHPKWPPFKSLDGLVLIDNATADLQATSARMLDSRLTSARVSLHPDSRRQLQLRVQGEIAGDAADGLSLVNTSPLRTLVGDTFVDWQLGGELHTQLVLHINLSDSSVPPQVNVDTRWNGVKLDIVPLNLQVDNIEGQLRYDTDRGFFAEGMTGMLWGRPATFGMSRVSEDGLASLDIETEGTVSADALRQWLNLDILRLASGETAVKSLIRIPEKGLPSFEAATDLAGIALDLPPPWSKPADERRVLSVTLPLAGEQRRLQVEMSDIYLTTSFKDGERGGSSVGFGAPLAQDEAGHFMLGGELERLNMQDWRSFIDRYVLTGETKGELVAGARGLQVKEIEMLGWRLRDMVFDAHQETGQWRIEPTMDWLRGAVTLPTNLEWVKVELQKLDLANVAAAFVPPDQDDQPSDSRLPPVDASIEELLHRGARWGNVSLNMRDEGAGYLIDNIRGELPGLSLGSEETGMTIRWLKGPDGGSTGLSGVMTVGDLGLALEAYQYDKIIKTKDGLVELELQWPGSPVDFSLATGNGKAVIDMGKGSFLKTPASGTLRVVSILDLANFLKRLSLDISRLFESGVLFDSIHGDVLLGDGRIDIPIVHVSGGSSQFQFTGTSDVLEQSLDGEFAATLPIASNLPWMAALVSGLPAAIAVFIISKLFTRQVNRFSSAIYTVEGTWDDPKIKFERIFDNKLEQRNVDADENGEAADESDEGEESGEAGEADSEAGNE